MSHPTETKALLVANCQGPILTQAMRVLAPSVDVEHVPSAQLRRAPFRDALAARIAQYDVVLLQPLVGEAFGPFQASRVEELHPDVGLFPPVVFLGFHPDCVYVGDGRIKSPIGDYHSSLALHGYLGGLGPAETLRMFHGDVYAAAGFFQEFAESKRRLVERWAQHGLDLRERVEEWERAGIFMHAINHPTSLVLADLARALLERASIPVLDCRPEQFVVDAFPDSAVFPVFPEIARRLGVRGHYVFKKAKALVKGTASPALTLEQFVEQSYACFEAHDRAELTCPRIEAGHYREAIPIEEFRARHAVGGGPASRRNPYADKPDYCYWRRSVERVPMEEVDPVVTSPISLSASDKIATAGSCFAQHIAKALAQNGYDYLVTESRPEGVPEGDPRAANYGVYTARFGNLYTARQLVQLFDRAYGDFVPRESAWEAARGAWVDPFRPRIQPGGFPSPEAVASARGAHFEAVRTMFETLDVFVFTLGLTEAWRDRRDGAVFPLAPGVAGGAMEPARYEFVNFGCAEIVDDLREFMRRLQRVNRGARMIVTVSPVPLVATYEDRHVLVSTTASKSILRAAADEFVGREPHAVYFPSYEIITGNFNRGAYFAEDLRSVRPEGVAHVMRLFLKHCGEARSAATSERPQGPADDAQRFELDALEQVICDEEALDP